MQTVRDLMAALQDICEIARCTEVILRERDGDELYEGSFRGIPEAYWGRAIISCFQICASSDPRRCGAYVLEV